MKNGKKPTVAERKHIEASKLNAGDWLISKKLSDTWTLVHRYVPNNTKEIDAP